MVFRIQRALEHGRKSAAFWMLLSILAVGLFVNFGSSKGWLHTSQSWADDKAPEPATAKSHFREGTELMDLVGKFKVVGERVVFVETTGQPRSFRCLENLAYSGSSKPFATMIARRVGSFKEK